MKALNVGEVRVLYGLCAGKSNAQIAADEYYAEKTVKNYCSIIFDELGVRNRVEAAMWVFRHGMPR